MIYSIEHRFVIIGTPRVASTSIAEAMIAAGYQCRGDQHAVPHDMPFRQIFHDPGPEWRIAVPIREHCDWWRSYYTYRVRERPLDVDWVKAQQEAAVRRGKRRWPYGCHWLYGQYLQYATHILRYETLQADLNWFMMECGADSVTLPQSNRSDFVSDIPNDVIDYICSWYKLERELLGYQNAQPQGVARDKVDARLREKIGAKERRPIEPVYSDDTGEGVSEDIPEVCKSADS